MIAPTAPPMIAAECDRIFGVEELAVEVAAWDDVDVDEALVEVELKGEVLVEEVVVLPVELDGADAEPVEEPEDEGDEEDETVEDLEDEGDETEPVEEDPEADEDDEDDGKLPLVISARVKFDELPGQSVTVMSEPTHVACVRGSAEGSAL